MRHGCGSRSKNTCTPTTRPSPPPEHPGLDVLFCELRTTPHQLGKHHTLCAPISALCSLLSTYSTTYQQPVLLLFTLVLPLLFPPLYRSPLPTPPATHLTTTHARLYAHRTSSRTIPAAYLILLLTAHHSLPRLHCRSKQPPTQWPPRPAPYATALPSSSDP